MTTIAVCSVKHAPGATTLALALATAWAAGGDADAVLIEADPAGGDLAARLAVPFDPGLASLAASVRHAGAELRLAEHVRPLPCGGRAVLAPSAPDEAAVAVAAVADRLAAEAGSRQASVVDCGRWHGSSGASALIAHADHVLVVVPADLAGLDHLMARIDAIESLAGRRLALALAASGPYRPDDVEAITGVPVVATVPRDRRGVHALHVGGRGAHRSLIVRTARSILERLVPTTAAAPAASAAPADVAAGPAGAPIALESQR